MYLKSLVLKGFKSFADRSVLTLQPGITAIVGPNGSGKSNISDAVLWVLGERSARNLRGQAMEDIIFSGSAARKAVSVAEVDLVLDNSDHVLPVDFDEVVVTRRMFRSGESEYLVNGVIARRLDVLDILHDSGLGTGTHSIISQGSLDSILQSKPEDRRALIEEAAGVLKHRRRKEKSARKIAQMENHLARVRDVTAEVQRQLGPLERKAKRAEAYKKARAELHDVRLALAVDDLRRLQREWDEVCAAEKSAAAAVDTIRNQVEEAERKVNDFQEMLRRESEGANVIARSQRRASNLSERMDSAERLLRERRRAAQDSLATMSAAVESANIKREEASRELQNVKEQLEEVLAQHTQAQEGVERLAAQKSEVEERSREVEVSLSQAAANLSACDSEWESAKKRHADLQQMLANGVAQAQLVESRRQELESQLEQARAEHEASKTELEKAQMALDDVAAREAQAQQKLVASFERRDAAHEKSDQAAKDVRVAQAESAAIERGLKAIRDGNPALSWVMKNSARFEGDLVGVSRGFKVKRGLESLVERLLGQDLAALAVDDPKSARSIADALDAEGVAGQMAMVIRSDESAVRAAQAYRGQYGHPLLEDLTYSDDMKPIVEALLGDVVVCPDRESAFSAHAASGAGVRFLSMDGCVIWPSGKVHVLGPDSTNDDGVIARERKLDEINDRLRELLDAQAIAEAEANEADEAYREVQAEAFRLGQQLANSKGARESAAADENRAAQRVQTLERDIEQARKTSLDASKEVDELRPNLEAAASKVDELAAKRESLVVERESLSAAVAPLREEASQIADTYAEARLQVAKLDERRTYVSRLVTARERDLKTIDADERRAHEGITVKSVAVKRADSALDVIEQISICLDRRVRLLDEAVSAQESNANSVHANAAAARDDARKAHDEYDSASSRMAQVRVDKSKLEIRVEAAVNVIVQDLHTPIDRAQELAQLEDRRTAEDESFRLQRKIKNMGTINPDAAEEYAQIKKRYDFLAGQLADMESAKRSLARIVKVIDARMRDDFVRTFEEVNRNFGEIFQELFPGGAAHLTLDDPDDVENTGVEVTAQPAGKRLTKMMLMSGGEKSLTALALLFAVYKTRATPFYILDEVEAALDDTNLRRLASYIDSLRDTTQLIMITHQRRTMEMADVLFGVSMHADGVTKVISQKLERALEQAE